MKMEVYTPNLELIGILESYDNPIIEDCAFTSGTFSFNSILNDNTRELLKEDNIIWFDAETAGIIEYFDKTSNEDGISFTIKGSLLTGLLKRRVLWGLYNFNASPTKIMYDTVADCAINPTRGNAEARKIPNLALAEQPEDTRTIRKQQTGGDLLSFCEEIGQATNTAFGVAFDPVTPSMKFWCRPCKNRTIHQTENEPVFYSTELDDVLNANYSYDASNYKNVAFVQGEGEGVNRVNTTVYKGVQTSEPEEPSLLPDGYVQLEYIESTGTQYIDTGFAPYSNSRIVCKIEPKNKTSTATIECFFGVRDSNASNAENQFALHMTRTQNSYRFDYFGANKTSSIPSTSSILSIDINGNIAKIQETEIVMPETSTNKQCVNSLFVFALNSAGTRGQFSLCKLYEMSIYSDENTKIRNFIPCKNPENQVGLYDIIDKKFYGNSGTGEFIAGNEVVKTKATINLSEPQGISRHEMYVDAKDLQKNSDPENPMTDEEYLQALNTRGQEKLSDMQLVQNFDASIRTVNPTYIYGKDFFLGDTITVIDKNLGVTVDAVVESVQRSFGSQGEQLSITFGYSTPLLSQRLRKAGI